MQSDRDDVEHGMQLVAKLPDIMPDQADARIKSLYEDIQQTLRVPLVNLIFRTLANYPDYFEEAWQQLSPALRTQGFEAASDDLRAQALLSPAPATRTPDWKHIEDLERLRAFNDTIHYVLPKLLLFATALHEAILDGTADGPAGWRSGAGRWSSEPLQIGAAEGTAKVEMVDPERASGAVEAIFQRIKERHGHPLVSSYYRGLANWPEFLEQAWGDIEPRVGSDPYEGCKHRLIQQAQLLAQDLFGSELDVQGLDREQRDQVRMILAAFRLKFIPEMLIDVCLIKSLLDGAERAARSCFSAT